MALYTGIDFVKKFKDLEADLLFSIPYYEDMKREWRY